MTTQEIVKIAEATAAANTADTFEVSVRNDRVCVRRPNQSKAHQDCGYVRISDLRAFPAYGTKARTARDHEALQILEQIATNLKNEEMPPAAEPVEFKSFLSR